MTDELQEDHETVISTPSDTEIRIERVFDAPRRLVWECFIDSALLSEWLGPRRLKMRVESYDFRPGGGYRYIHSDEEGNEYVFFGEFKKIEEPRLLIWTFNYVMEPQPPASIDRFDFEEIDGQRTRMVSLSSFESKQLRDGMIQSGMEKGVVEGHERLDELLIRRA